MKVFGYLILPVIKINALTVRDVDILVAVIEATLTVKTF